MSLSDHPKAYGTAAIAVAFAAGVAATLGFKELYPELESRYQHKSAVVGSRRRSAADPRRSSLFWSAPVQLEDHDTKTASSSSLVHAPEIATSGIEGCIGNTPLIRLNRIVPQGAAQGDLFNH